MAEKGKGEVEPDFGVDVSNLPALDKIASPSVIQRLKNADLDKDGRLSVSELVQLVQSEQRALADRRLFRNLLIAIVVAVLILVSALVGAVYGIVKLTDEVDDSNGLLVSAKTGSVMATGKATEVVLLSQLYAKASNSTSGSTDPVSIANQMDVVVVPHDEVEVGFTVHRVASIRSYPSEQLAIIVSKDGSVIQVDSSGLRYVRDPLVDLIPESSLPNLIPVNNSSSGQRRKLSEVVPFGGYGVTSRRVIMDAPFYRYLDGKSKCCRDYLNRRKFFECFKSENCLRFDYNRQVGGNASPSFYNFQLCVDKCYQMYCYVWHCDFVATNSLTLL